MTYPPEIRIKPFLVHVLADYGPIHDLAFAEVKQALRAEIEGQIAHFETFAVPAFDTVATGFYLAQTACNSSLGERQIFYVNTAPRRDDRAARKNCAGEGLVYAELANGVQIIAVNSGYSLSFIKGNALKIQALDIAAEGSQFRSRDVFPAALGWVVRDELDPRLGADVMGNIPDIPSSAVAYTDGYGNIKTTIDVNEIAHLKGQKVAVSIGEQTHDALVSNDIFAVEEGEMVVSAGSSGWRENSGSTRRFVECVLRGGSAAERFGRPGGGSAVSFRPY